MNLKFFSALGLFCTSTLYTMAVDPVIMKIGDSQILKSEFEYIYNKNNSVSNIDKKSKEEFVDLFVNYKLKVKEAVRMGLDEKPTYKAEYEQYEKQLCVPYMRNKELEQSLLKEAFERKQYELLASHILIKINSDTDTVAAWNKINDIYKELTSGADFAQCAQKYSDCPSKTSGGSLGYFSAFDMVYSFENAAYSTAVGSFSKPFRTQFGYHIVKIYDKRKAILDRKFSHILIKNDRQDYMSVADSVYKLVLNDGDFAQLAKKFSNDYLTSEKGGDLGFLSKGMFPPQIQSAVKSMKTIGEVKKVSSAFGIHILKLTETISYDSIESCMPELEKKLAKSDRSEQIDKSYMDDLERKYNLVKYESALQIFYDLMKISDENERKLYYRNMDELLYEFNGNSYPQSAFLSAFRQDRSQYEVSRKRKGLPRNEADDRAFVKKSFNQYLTNLIFSYERDILVNANPDLKNLLREYSDGLLLFDVCSQKIWDKASSDVQGMQAYFEKNKNKYTWDKPRFKGVIILSKTKEDLATAEKIVKEESTYATAEKKIKETMSGNVKIGKGVYAQGANKAVDEQIYKNGKYDSKEYPYASVIGQLISSPEQYEDVKGPVTADYQNYLEEEWIKELRGHYVIKINEDVLKTVK